MSRSSQRTAESSSSEAAERTRRARPRTRSDNSVLRLWGMALEPCWASASKGSRASPTSVMPSRLTLVVMRARVEAMTARCETTSAWRSREITCVGASSGRRPSRRRAASSISGEMKTWVPTSPDSLPTAMIRAARSMRSRPRRTSATQPATWRPNVWGTACWPCVRAIWIVSRWRTASRPSAPSTPATSPRRRSRERRICRLSDVSRTSLLVLPR